MCSFFCVPSKYFQKVWTGGQTLKIIIKKKIFNLMYINIIKCGLVDLWTCCGLVDKKLSSYFMFSFFGVPSKIFSKSVDRWTCSEKSEIKIILMYFIILNCGRVNMKLSFYFMFSFFHVPSKMFSKSVDRWTNSESSEKKRKWKGHVITGTQGTCLEPIKPSQTRHPATIIANAPLRHQ